MDEAETGLKSSLAVKIFGADLDMLESKAEAVQKVLTLRCRAFRTSRSSASSDSQA